MSATQDGVSLVALTIGPYFNVVGKLGREDLQLVDVASRSLHRENDILWQELGVRTFRGLSLYQEGLFEDALGTVKANSTKRKRVDWRARFRRFTMELYHFRPFLGDFDGRLIAKVRGPDEVAYCKCLLRADVLASDPDFGMYLEMDVSCNSDNISLSMVDFDDGGKSSITFGPATGAVLRETKTSQCLVRGAYIQPLPRKAEKFQGLMGLYIKGGEVAFFRKAAIGDSEHETEWETTGFVIDLKWAEGKRLTPCLAFRDAGTYRVAVTRVSSIPPMMPKRDPSSFLEGSWRAFTI